MAKTTCRAVPCPGSAAMEDLLTEVLRDGARRMLIQALEAEVDEYIEKHAAQRDEDGHRLVVRNGYMPERSLLTPMGPMAIEQPRVEDRRIGEDGEKIRFASRILPPYLRKTKQIDELLPWLYLKGISTNDFSEALAALLGPDAAGLSAATVSRLKGMWEREHQEWSRRSLRGKRYVYMWVDGVYFGVRLEAERQCILIVMGAAADGRKELVAVHDGVRESEQSWMELLLDLKARGLKNGPELAIGDGALGFWKALPKVYGKCRMQRCWVHKTANVLNYLPKSAQAGAKAKLHEIWMAETRAKAEEAFDAFVEMYGAKYPKAVECLKKDREALLTFYNFPAEHWVHIRTTNPIESVFATVRLRTDKTKGCGTRSACLAMVFKLAQSAERRWRRLNGSKLFEDVMKGVKFVDGRKEEAA